MQDDLLTPVADGLNNLFFGTPDYSSGEYIELPYFDGGLVGAYILPAVVVVVAGLLFFFRSRSASWIVIPFFLGYFLPGFELQNSAELHFPNFSVDLVPVVYGYPSQELFDAARSGQVILGGCTPLSRETVLRISY